MANVLEITDGNFETEVLKSDAPVLLDFSAVWCGPCKAIAPVIEKIAVEYAGKVKVGKLDIDDSPKVPAKFGIKGVPTMIVFKGGQEVGRHVGAQGNVKDTLVKMLGV